MIVYRRIQTFRSPRWYGKYNLVIIIHSANHCTWVSSIFLVLQLTWYFPRLNNQYTYNFSISLLTSKKCTAWELQQVKSFSLCLLLASPRALKLSIISPYIIFEMFTLSSPSTNCGPNLKCCASEGIPHYKDYPKLYLVINNKI